MSERRSPLSVQFDDEKERTNWAETDKQLDQLFRLADSQPIAPVSATGKVNGFDARWLKVVFVAANTDLFVVHRLGRIPVGMVQVETPGFPGFTPIPGQVTFGSIAPTSTHVTLRCTGASKTALIVLF